MSEIKNSPSYKDGIDNLTESRYRTEGVKFITTIGQKIGLYPNLSPLFAGLISYCHTGLKD